jgi:hypothetical protein
MNEKQKNEEFHNLVLTVLNNVIETYRPYKGDTIKNDDVIPTIGHNNTYGIKIEFKQNSPLFICFERMNDSVVVDLICDIKNEGVILEKHQDLLSNIVAINIEDVIRTFVDKYKLTIYP